MLEIEKKFDRLTPEQRARLIEGAQFVATVHNVDVYYDDARYSLTTQDRWLRQRNGAWVLKLPLQDRSDPNHKADFDHYRELEEPVKIAQALGLVWPSVVVITDREQLQIMLAAIGIVPFATIDATREKYCHGRFTIDIDQTTFGYELAEIEAEAANEDDIEATSKAVTDFALTCGLTMRPVRGKLPEFLLRHNRDHYDALVRAGVVTHYES
ncbi:MAG: CYTH domain-containing protein [bacterium]|nr:CYTH domain-containing protein [bacterium]